MTLTIATWKNKGDISRATLLFPENGSKPDWLAENIANRVKANLKTLDNLVIGTFSPLVALAAERACKENGADVQFEIDEEKAGRKEFLDYLLQGFKA
jgi:hypothetical protein